MDGGDLKAHCLGDLFLRDTTVDRPLDHPVHRAVKTAIRWTGASERTVKHWLAGTHAPRRSHLIELVRHSDKVLGDLSRAAGPDSMAEMVELAALRSNRY